MAGGGVRPGEFTLHANPGPACAALIIHHFHNFFISIYTTFHPSYLMACVLLSTVSSLFAMACAGGWCPRPLRVQAHKASAHRSGGGR